MELQIQDLVSSIKREGIEEAEKEKALIIDNANAQARQIVEAAKAEASRIADAGRRELELQKESTISATSQACRDTIIALKKELSDILVSLLAEKVGKTLDSQAVAGIVIAALGGEDPGKYELQVRALDAELKKALSDQIAKGLKLNALPGIDGFRLQQKDGAGFYDFSDEQIARVLKPFIGDLVI